MVRVFLFCALILISGIPTARAQIYLDLAGSVQGNIEGDDPFPLASGTILVNSFAVDIIAEFDPITGFPTGRVSVTPLTLEKFWDSSTIKILNAMSIGEPLTTCLLQVMEQGTGGQLELALELTLFNASFDGWDVTSDGPSSTETISIFFDSMEWRNNRTGDVYTYTMGLTTVRPGLTESLALATTPNPTSGDTEFGFRLPSTGKVLIEVYDVRGRHVATVFDGEVGVDRGIVHWDGRDTVGNPVASGAYLVKMQAGSWLTSQKMVVMR